MEQTRTRDISRSVAASDQQAILLKLEDARYLRRRIMRSFGSFSGFAGSVALAFIMIPIIGRSVEEILHLVPNSLREAGLALGVPRWRVIMKVVIPTVLPGMLTGIVLSLARAAGETAPL